MFRRATAWQPREVEPPAEVPPPFDSLPLALHLRILNALPLVWRARTSLVCRRWAEAARDASLYAHLSFEGCRPKAVDGDTLLALCRRAGPGLASLDTSDPACGGLSLTLSGNDEPGGPFLGVVPNHGDVFGPSGDRIDTTGLRSLITWQPGRGPVHRKEAGAFMLRIRGESGARALLSACPLLETAAVSVAGSLQNVAAALELLPAAGAKRACIDELHDGSDSEGEGPSFAKIADDLCNLLLSSSITELDFDCCGSGLASLYAEATADTADPAAFAATCAAARLAAALARPATGVRALSGDLATSELLAAFCRALTPESPLEELDLEPDLPDEEDGQGVHDESAQELAIALAEGRCCRLRRLSLAECDLNVTSGADDLFDALGASSTLTELDLTHTTLYDSDVSNLAVAIRRSTTLRTLRLSRADFGSPHGLALVLGALGGSDDGSGGGSVVDLEMQYLGGESLAAALAGAALAGSLLRGSPLEAMSARGCMLEAAGAVPLAAALGALAGARQMRLRELDLRGNHVGDATVLPLARFVLANPACTLTHLVLSDNRISDAIGAEVANALAAAGGASCLEHLDLASNNLGNAAAAAFGRALAAQGSRGALRTLLLSRNAIWAQGVEALAAGLAGEWGVSQLVTLGLSHIASLTHAAASALGAAISVSGGAPAQSPHCSGGGGGDAAGGGEGGSGWGLPLKRTGLRRLEVAACHLTDEGIAAMCAAGLLRSRTLEHIDVSSSGYNALLTGEGVLTLARAAARDRYGVVGAGTGVPPPPRLTVMASDIRFSSAQREELARIEEEAVAAAAAAGVAAAGGKKLLQVVLQDGRLLFGGSAS